MFLVLVVPIIVRAPYRGFRNLNNTSIFQIYGFKKKKVDYCIVYKNAEEERIEEV